jgi:hypothetical protein
VKKFTCGKDKSAYICRFGIAPYFTELLHQEISRCEEFVLLFDESMNSSTHNKQLDIHIRFWHANHVVKTRYFTSEFMGHATAEQLLSTFMECVGKLNLSKLVQLSMDGPNVNQKLFDMIQTDLKTNISLTLLDIGSCNLHVVHGAFRDGAHASGWDLEQILSSFYSLFKDTPARREDFTDVTGSELFPLKFCSHRWTENVPVCERALELLPHLQTYLAAIVSGKFKSPDTRAFFVVRDACKDPLLKAKILFCLSIA